MNEFTPTEDVYIPHIHCIFFSEQYRQYFPDVSNGKISVTYSTQATFTSQKKADLAIVIADEKDIETVLQQKKNIMANYISLCLFQQQLHSPTELLPHFNGIFPFLANDGARAADIIGKFILMCTAPLTIDLQDSIEFLTSGSGCIWSNLATGNQENDEAYIKNTINQALDELNLSANLKSLFITIQAGLTFSLEDFNLIGTIARERIPEDATVSLATDFDPTMDKRISVAVYCVSDKA